MLVQDHLVPFAESLNVTCARANINTMHKAEIGVRELSSLQCEFPSSYL